MEWHCPVRDATEAALRACECAARTHDLHDGAQHVEPTTVRVQANPSAHFREQLPQVMEASVEALGRRAQLGGGNHLAQDVLSEARDLGRGGRTPDDAA